MIEEQIGGFPSLEFTTLNHESDDHRYQKDSENGSITQSVHQLYMQKEDSELGGETICYSHVSASIGKTRDSWVRIYTTVDSEVCKCRCRMSTGFPENVDGNVKNMLIYHDSHKKDTKGHELKFEHIRTV
jgi:hypothetical protein